MESVTAYNFSTERVGDGKGFGSTGCEFVALARMAQDRGNG